MRDKPFAAVLAGLQKRTPLIVLLGTGGVGKSTLAIEVGTSCFVPSKQAQTPASDRPQFEGVIWISDKWRPGVTRLVTVLDEIVYTLGYPGYAQLELPDKQRAVDQLLRFLRVLVIVDNFETVADDALVDWLLNLPFPSKALVTTREYREAFQQGGYLVELAGMRRDEARAFIRIWEEQHFVRNPLGDAVSDSVIDATGGNPQAIKHVLGLYKRTGQPIATLIAASETMATLLDSLFRSSWAALHTEVQSLLLVVTLFSGSVDREVLGRVAGFDQATFGESIESLVELALIDVDYGDGLDGAQQPRYSLHPLVRQFVLGKYEQAAKQAPTDTTQAFVLALSAAYERWLAWAIERAGQVGYVPKDVPGLRRVTLDAQTLANATSWALEHGRLRETIALVHGLEFLLCARVVGSKAEAA